MLLADRLSARMHFLRLLTDEGSCLPNTLGCLLLSIKKLINPLGSQAVIPGRPATKPAVRWSRFYRTCIPPAHKALPQRRV